MSGKGRKPETLVLNGPMTVLRVGDPWQQVFPREAALKDIWMNFMLDEERRFMYHDDRIRWASDGSLVYPITRDKTKCSNGQCRCHLEKHEDEQCPTMSTSVPLGTRLKSLSRFVRTTIPYRVRRVASQWLMSLTDKVSPS